MQCYFLRILDCNRRYTKIFFSMTTTELSTTLSDSIATTDTTESIGTSILGIKSPIVILI